MTQDGVVLSLQFKEPVYIFTYVARNNERLRHHTVVGEQFKNLLQLNPHLACAFASSV